MRDSDWLILSTLYQCRNITKTASRLFLTQPALTKRIRVMEQEWGGAIIHSSNKGIAFTPLGEYLATSAADVNALLDRIHSHVSESDNGSVGRLRIGSPNSFIRFHLPGMIRQYKETYPLVDFAITTCLSDSIPKLFSERHIQVGFFCGDYPCDGTLYQVGQSRCYLVSREPVAMEDLPKMSQIEYVKGYLTLQMQERWWKERFSEAPHVDYAVHQADTGLEMIQQGLGYGFFSMDYNFSAYPNLCVQPLEYLDGTPMVRNNWMVYDPDDLRYALIRNFVEHIIRETEERKRQKTAQEETPKDEE